MTSLADFDLADEPLGEGAYGTVYRCTHRATGQRYAVKCLIISQVLKQKHGMQQVMTEKAALIAMEEHPSVVRLHFTFKDADQLYLVTELAGGGALFDEIRRLGACHLSCARWLIGELVNALEFMHSKRIVHRDLKPENILLDDVGHIKLIDFGSARLLDSTENGEAYDTFVGTAEYLSPELLRDEECREAADLWALGCILFQMLRGSPPFQVLGSPHLTMEMIKAWPMEYHDPASLDALPETARTLIVALLHPEPTQRLGAPGSSTGEYPALRAHPFFSAADPPLDFDMLTSTPPPPLVPPPPLPAIHTDGTVLNSELAQRPPLPKADRAILMESQSRVKWSPLLDAASTELVVLATLVTKRRHLSAKRRQLLLVEGLLSPPSLSRQASPDVRMPPSVSRQASADTTHPPTAVSAVDVSDGTSRAPAETSRQGPADWPAATCRLFYIDPSTLEGKGTIPWTRDLRAELLPKGHFRIHTPGALLPLATVSALPFSPPLVPRGCDLRADVPPRGRDGGRGRRRAMGADDMQPAGARDTARAEAGGGHVQQGLAAELP